MLLHGKRAALNHLFSTFQVAFDKQKQRTFCQTTDYQQLTIQSPTTQMLGLFAKTFSSTQNKRTFCTFFSQQNKPQMALYQEQIEAHGEIHSCGKQAKAKDNQQFTEIELTR